jgi:uncharacterized membrane protein
MLLRKKTWTDSQKTAGGRMVYLYVLISVVCMSAAHLLVKKGITVVGQYPQSVAELLPFFGKVFTNMYILGALALALITGLSWFLALTRAELSHIYPFVALSFILIGIFSALIFNENVTVLRWVGIAIVCVGVAIVARS